MVPTMTLIARLKSTTAAVSRGVLGAALGLGLAFAVAASPAQALAATAVQPSAESGPALWVIRDADSTIYLLGSVHVLRPTTQWASDRVDQAFDSANTIWFEITNPDDQAAAMPLIAEHGLSLDRPLSSRLTAEEWAEVQAAARTSGTPAAQLEAMQPWLAALSLSMAPLIKAGYDPKSGVEVVLRDRAQKAGKPIRGLETMEQQIRLLAGLSEEAQMAFLRSALETFEEATPRLDGMVQAWAEGDVARIERLGVDQIRKESEEVYQAVLARRNADWANQIKTLLDGSGVDFIAVGAAHLAGPDSVQALLAQKGVQADRVD